MVGTPGLVPPASAGVDLQFLMCSPLPRAATTTAHSRWQHTEHPRHLCCGLPARDDRLGNLATLGVVQLPTPSTDPAPPPLPAASPAQVRSRTMARLKLGQGANHLHHHPSRRRGGVDFLGQRSEASSRLALILHPNVHQVLPATANSRSRFPDYATPPVVQQALQFGAVPSAAELACKLVGRRRSLPSHASPSLKEVPLATGSKDQLAS